MIVLKPEAVRADIGQSLALWCAQRIGLPRLFENYAVLAVFDKALKAVIVYHNWYPEHGVIEMSCAGEGRNWMTRPVLREMFAFPFERRGCQLVVLRVSERNRDENGRGLQRMLCAYGFNETRIPRLRGRDEAELIYTLADDDWRANGFHKEHA